jgi:hypothetical protein
VLVLLCIVVAVAAVDIRPLFSERANTRSLMAPTVQGVGAVIELFGDSAEETSSPWSGSEELASDGIVQPFREEAVRMAKAHESITLYAGTRIRVESDPFLLTRHARIRP